MIKDFHTSVIVDLIPIHIAPKVVKTKVISSFAPNGYKYVVTNNNKVFLTANFVETECNFKCTVKVNEV